MTLEQYRTQLASLGPQGQAAFQQVARAVATAEVPVISLNQKMQNLIRTFANTLRYQISTAAIAAVTRGISEAVDYAQDLNESLNNIRIVTGKNIAEMERFADKANKAAKALNATTTEYTNASLIYFQQGLDVAEVEKRTAVTVKMAQVTGQAMEETSDQLTAVWNNFYDGSKSLEYYADVITALGAATASSADEITQGLEKFAAVAETVGLSYEYATAALATVTATTRQSADVVGTAFKTLFARMQDLELGKTLDDGTTLGKYSQALDAVGVRVLDVTGNMRDMDDILDDLAKRWNSLNGAQQTALAQTVAGARQYTQLVALMSNWDAMQTNLITAQNSTGALNEQAEIYAESWEAARDRVKASLESIYSQIIDDEAFIKLTDGLADFITFLSDAIEGVGGLKTVLLLLGSVAMKQVQPALHNMANSFRYTFTAAGKAEMQATKESAARAYTSAPVGLGRRYAVSAGISNAAGRSMVNTQEEFDKAMKTAPEGQRQILTSMMDASLGKTIEFQEKGSKVGKLSAEGAIAFGNAGDPNRYNKPVPQTENVKIERAMGHVGAGSDAYKNALYEMDVELDTIEKQAEEAGQSLEAAFGQQKIEALKKLRAAIQDAFNEANPTEKNIEAVRMARKEFNNTPMADVPPTADQQAVAASEMQKGGKLAQQNARLVALNDPEKPLLMNATDIDLVGMGASEQKRQLEDLKLNIESITAVAKEANGGLKGAFGEKGAEAIQEYEKRVDDLLEKLKELKGQSITDDILEDIGGLSISGIDTAIKEQEKAAQGSFAIAQNNGATPEQIQEYTNKMVAAGKAEGEYIHEGAGVVASNKRIAESFKTKSIQNFGDSLSSASTILMSFSSVITTTIGLFQTLSDESATVGEKITAAFSALPAILMSVSMGYKALNEESGQKIVNKLIEIGQNKIELRQLDEYLAKKKVELVLEKADAVTPGDGPSGSDSNESNVFKNLGSKFKQTGSKVKGGWKQFWSGKGGAALKGVAKIALPILAAAAVVTAVALPVIAELKKEEKAVEATQATARQAADAFSEAQSAQQEFNSGINNYKSAQKGLEGLIKGTAEYTSALIEANAQATELLTKYKELTFTVEEGQIIIDKASIEKVQQQQLSDIARTSINSSITARENREAQLALDTVNFTRQDVSSKSGSANRAGNTAVGAATGAGAVLAAIGTAAAMGTTVGPIGTIVGAVVGALIGGIIALTQKTSSEIEEASIQQFADLKKNDPDAYVKAMQATTYEGFIAALQDTNISLDDEKLLKSLYENRKSLDDLTTEINSLKAQEDVQWKTWYQQKAASESALYQNFVDQNFLGDMAATNSYQAKVRGRDYANNLSKPELAEAYMQAMYGDDWKEKGKVENVRGTTGFTVYLKNAEGEYVMQGEKNGITFDSARSVVANNIGLDYQLNASTAEWVGSYMRQKSTLSNLGIEDKYHSPLITDYLVNNKINLLGSGLTYKEMQAIAEKTSEQNDALSRAYNTAWNTYLSSEAGQSINQLVNADIFKNASKAEQEYLWTLHFDEDAAFDQIKKMWEEGKDQFENNAYEIKFKSTQNLFDLITQAGGRFATEESTTAFWKYIKDGLGRELTPEDYIKYGNMSNAEIIAEFNEGYNFTKSGAEIIAEQQQNQTNYEKETAEAEKAWDAAHEERKDVTWSSFFDATQFYKPEANTMVQGNANGIDYKFTGTENGGFILTDNGKKLDLNDRMLLSLVSGENAMFRADEGYGLNEHWITEDAKMNLASGVWTTGNPLIDLALQKSTAEEINSVNGLQEALTEELSPLYPQVKDWTQFTAAHLLQIYLAGKAAMGADFIGMERNVELETKATTEQTEANDAFGKLQESATEMEQQRQNIATRAGFYGVDTTELESYATYLQQNNDALKENSLLAYEVAEAHLRMRKGLKDVASNWTKWTEAMSKGGAEAGVAWGEISQALANILNTDVDHIDENVYNSLSGVLTQYANGIQITYQDIYDSIIQNAIASNETLKGQYDALISYMAGQNFILGDIDPVSAQNLLNVCKDLASKGQIALAETFAQDFGFTLYEDAEGYHIRYDGDKSDSYVPQYSSSGGGGKTDKELLDLDEEIERYHEINEVLEDLERKYNHLKEARERAFGASALKYFDEEQKVLEQQLDAEEEKLRQIEENRAKDLEKIMQYGVSVDEQGRITNWTEVMTLNAEAVNQAREDYNNGLISEEELEAREKAYEDLQKYMQRYEETNNELQEQQETVWQTSNALMDLGLEEIQYIAEYGLGLVEDKLTVIDHQLKMMEDDAYSTAETLALLGQKMEATSQKGDIARNTIADILASHGLSLEQVMNASPEELETLLANNNFTSMEIDEIRNSLGDLAASNEEMKENAKAVQDALTNLYESFSEEVTSITEKISHLADTTKKYRDIINLVGKDNLGVSDALLNTMNQVQIQASQNQVAIARETLETYQKNLAEQRARYAEATSEEERKQIEENIKALEEQTMQWQSTLTDALTSALQTITDAFKDTLERITKAFEQQFAGMYGTVANLQEAFKQQGTINDRYLADYAKIYELSKLTRDITKTMDESDSIRAKAKLKDLQEEIYALQESGAEMTKYEVDELRARYELRLAEIALEEAQNAKSQVRMSRDSEGNWSYVYSADQESVAEAEQNYEDKLYAYQNLTQEYLDKMQEQIIGIPTQLTSALMKIYQDSTLTKAQKQMMAQQTIDFYKTQYQYLGGELEKAGIDSKTLYQIDWQNYSEATGYKISANEEWIDSFDELTWAQLTGYDTMDQALNDFVSSTNILANDIENAYAQMETAIANTMDASGLSVTDFTNVMQSAMAQNIEDLKDYQEQADGVIAKMGDEIEASIGKANDFWKAYATWVQTSYEQNEAIVAYMPTLITEIGKLNTVVDDLAEGWETVAQNAQVAQEAQVSASGNGLNGTVPVVPTYETKNITISNLDGATKSLALTANEKHLYRLESGSNYTFIDGVAHNTLYKQNDNSWAQYYIRPETWRELLKWNIQKVQKNEITSSFLGFDTGGYTGSWDSSGRLAMLHQKELVLNADDTAKFLAAIDIVRDISRIIDLNATAQSGLFNLLNTTTVGLNGQILEQQVTIHAEFPNATNHNEIEEAFNSLINRASQFANRKK